MGVYLSRPRTAKESEHGAGDLTRYGVTAMQGWRQHMEDAHIADPLFLTANQQKSGAWSDELQGMQVYGVFDGHGGAAVAGWVAETLGPYLKEELSRVREDASSGIFTSANADLPDWLAQSCEALRRVFVRLDDEMVRPQARQMMQRLTQKQNDKEAALAKEEEAQDPKVKTTAPAAFLQALLSGANGHRPMVRIVEQYGQKYYQLVPSSMEDDEDGVRNSDDDEDRMDEDDDHGLYGSNSDNEHTDASPRGPCAAAAADDDGTDQNVATAPVSATTFNGKSEETYAGCSGERQLSATAKNADNEEEDEGTSATATSDNLGGEEASCTTDLSTGEGTTTTTLEIDTNGMNSSLYDPEAANYPEVSGTTAIVAAVIPGPPPVLVVANAGDSRAVLSRGGIAVPLSYDHKPDLPREKNRIVNAGGKVTHGRIDGNLNLSRTVGDLSFKGNKDIPVEGQKISVVPDVSLTLIQPDDEFVIIACDGIWDCLTNQAAVDLISAKMHDSPERDADGCLPPEAIARICEEICDQCLSKDPMKSDGGIGCDNMTLMTIQLNPALLKRAAETDRRKMLPTPLSDGATIFYGEGPDFEATAVVDDEDGEGSSNATTALAV